MSHDHIHDERDAFAGLTSGQSQYHSTTMSFTDRPASPEDATTLFSGGRGRSSSIETDISEVTTTSSEDTIYVPPVPVNSPEASIAGDRASVISTESIDTASIMERLQLAQIMDAVPKDNGKARLHRPPRENVSLQQLFKSAPLPRQRPTRSLQALRSPSKAHSKLDHSETPEEVVAKDTTFEHSTWVELAEEDVTRALARLAMAAKDLHTKSDVQTVPEVYSTLLAKLIKKAEIQFDARLLD